MAVLQVAVFLVSSLLLMAGSGNSQNIVSLADEDRAIGMIRQMIQDLEEQQRPGLNNVCKLLVIPIMIIAMSVQCLYYNVWCTDSIICMYACMIRTRFMHTCNHS